MPIAVSGVLLNLVCIVTDDCIGIESRLAGAASFERLVG